MISSWGGTLTRNIAPNKRNWDYPYIIGRRNVPTAELLHD